MTTNTSKLGNAGLKKGQIKLSQSRMMEGEVFYCGGRKMFYKEGCDPFRALDACEEKKIEVGSPIYESYNNLENWQIQIDWKECLPILCCVSNSNKFTPVLIVENDNNQLYDSDGTVYRDVRPVTKEEIKKYIF